MGQGLRQDDQPHRLPVRQPHCLRALILAFVNRLQTTADNLSHIRSREQHHPDQRPQQIIKIHTFWQEQRQHYRGHEQHSDQRHTAPELDENRT